MSEVKRPLLTGVFVNKGNTCYMNCIFQMLVNSPYLLKLFLQKKTIISNNKEVEIYLIDELIQNKMIRILIKNEEKNININKLEQLCGSTITYHIAHLFRTFADGNYIIDPESIVYRIRNDRDGKFKGTSQQCSVDFLRFLMTSIREETSCNVSIDMNSFNKEVVELYDERKQMWKNNDDIGIAKSDQKPNAELVSVIEAMNNSYFKDGGGDLVNIVYGLTITTIKCPNNHCIYTAQPFLDLPIGLPFGSSDKVSLIDCMYEEWFQKIDNYNCSLCDDKTNIVKSTKLFSIPPVLFISLQRADIYGGKSKTIIDIPMEIDFADPSEDGKYNFVSNYCDQETVYELQGVAMHMGGKFGGHYYCFIKNMVNNQWYKADDECSRLMKEEHIKSQLLSRNPYLLMYTVKDSKI